jgi:hypothetical protein
MRDLTVGDECPSTAMCTFSELGVQHLRATGTLEVTCAPDKVCYRDEFSLPGICEVVPPDAEAVKRVKDPSLAPAIRKALAVQAILMCGTPGSRLMALPNLWTGEYLNLDLDLAFDVFIRVKGTEYPIGPVYIERHDPEKWCATPDAPYEGPAVDRADVIFRSSSNDGLSMSPEALMGLIDIWDGEIVFEDVPMRPY